MTEEIKNNATSNVTEEVKQEENVMDKLVHGENDPVITLRKLIDAGVHYGHQTRKWNPKMKPYIYGARNGIYLIDLNKTKEAIETSYKALQNIVTTNNGKILFVGTKQNAKEIVKISAQRSGSFYITNRWLGGILTNFKTIQTRIKKLKDLEKNEEDGTWDALPKKEAAQLRKEKEKLSKNLEGIKEMRTIPNALIVVDPMIEHNAVKEANKLGIPVFAICDTNCDPDGVNYVIPGNDDADKSVNILIQVLADAIAEARGELPEIAYTKDEGNELTMKDAQKMADRENALRIAARKEIQKERLEKEKLRRMAFENRGDKKPENAQPSTTNAAETTPATSADSNKKPVRKTVKKAETSTNEVK